MTAPTSESYRENRRWRRRGKRKTMRIAAAAAHIFMFVLPFSSNEKRRNYGRTEKKNDSLISSFSLSAGQKEKHTQKRIQMTSEGGERRLSRDISCWVFFFITVLAESASYRRYFLLLTGKAVCTTDDAAIISLSPSVSNINSHFWLFSSSHLFESCVCVCVDFELVCSWLRLNKLPQSRQGNSKFL